MNRSTLVFMNALILLGSVVVISLPQHAYAPRACPGSGQFGELTGEFIVNVAKAIGNPNDSPEFAEFRLLTAQFERDASSTNRKS